MQQPHISRTESGWQWEVVTKTIVVFSICAAELTRNFFLTLHSPIQPVLAVLLLLGTRHLARRFSDYTVAVVLALFYLIRGIQFFVFQQGLSDPIPLAPALLGLILSRPVLQAWHLPRAWQFPLVLWALIIALSWPIVVFRELNFVFPFTLDFPPLINNSKHLPSHFVATWVMQTAVTQGIGFLWLDWLFATFPQGQQERLRRWVLIPLALSFCLSSLVALYQAVIDIHFLNSPFWAKLGRAPGTLFDANPFGVLAACWGPALVALTLSGQLWERKFFAALIPLPWFAMLAAGSTSALLVITPATLSLLWIGWKALQRERKPVLALSSLVILCLLGGVLWAFSSLPSIKTPFEKLADIHSGADQSSPVSIIKTHLRDRPFFVFLASRITADLPLSGLGLGTFNALVGDFAHKYGTRSPYAFDNALNWYFHQLAELGIFGSIAWGWWLIVFIRTLILSHIPGDARAPSLLKVTLLGFGLASCFGVHAQNWEMSLTFWMYTFWLASYVPHLSKGHKQTEATPWGWLTIIAIACLYTGFQSYASATTLRIASRAAMAGWEYSYGFYAWEEWPGVGPVRWTHREAEVTVPIEGPVLRFALKASHPDIEQKPVLVDIFIDGQQILKVWLRNHAFSAHEIPLPPNKQQVTLQIQVDRTWRPIDYGSQDVRSLGVAVTKWQFIPVKP